MSQQPSLGTVATSLTPTERFEEYLQSRGMRNTEQRRILIGMVYQQHDHFDADQLIERLPAKGAAGYVSRPTVYRTLSEFVDAGLLRTIQLDGRTVYEHDYGYPQHDHLYCTECEKLIEFTNEEILKLREALAAQHSFRVLSHRLIIHGVCETCRLKKRRVRHKQERV